MEKGKLTAKRKHSSWLPILITSGVVLLVCSLLAFTVFRYQINPDGISYINIAKRYAALDIQSGINGYWGPLLSWMLVPFIWIGADSIVSTYIIGVLASIGLVLSLHKFALKKLTSIKPLPLYLIETTLLLVLSSFALSVLTPDIILSFALFIVFLAFVGFNDRPTIKNAILLGGAGALTYFAKPVGLLLFVFVLVAYAIYFIIQKKPGRKILLVPMATFLVLSVPYISALSLKYGHFTFATSSSYNLSLISPTNHRVQPITQPGIYLPAEHYNSVWDDPSNLPLKSWNPLKSAFDFKYYANEVLGNVHSLTVYASDLGMAFLLGLASLAAAVILVRKLRFEALIASALVIGLVGLYALSVVEPRHLWPLIAFSFMGILFMVDYMARKTIGLHQLNVFVALAVIVLSLPLLIPVNTGDVAPPYHNSAMALAKYLPAGSRITADNADIMYICFTLDIQCAGILPVDANQDTINLLRKNNILYLKLDDPTRYTSILNSYYKTVDPDLHLYMLR